MEQPRVNARRERDNGPVLRRPQNSGATSGAKGFAAIFGAMVGIIGLLWLIATLVAPH